MEQPLEGSKTEVENNIGKIDNVETEKEEIISSSNCKLEAAKGEVAPLNDEKENNSERIVENNSKITEEIVKEVQLPVNSCQEAEKKSPIEEISKNETVEKKPIETEENKEVPDENKETVVGNAGNISEALTIDEETVCKEINEEIEKLVISEAEKQEQVSETLEIVSNTGQIDDTEIKNIIQEKKVEELEKSVDENPTNSAKDEKKNESEDVNERKLNVSSVTSDDVKIQKSANSGGDESEYETLEEDNLEEERPEEYGSESEEVGDEEDEVEEEEDEEEDDGAASENREGSESSSPELVINEERQAADGQESDKKERKLDHDEDRRDPQYIPKKGMFYEHDDRTADGEEQNKEPPRNTKKGKVWDSKECWFHDLYVDSEQVMKSTEELITIYGYDIRKDDGPPKARRRRRYVKGPNKYERSWEDEQAYIKSSGRGGFRGGRRAGRVGGRLSGRGGGGNVEDEGEGATGTEVKKEFVYKASDFPVHQPKKSSQPFTTPSNEENWDPPAQKPLRPQQQQQQQHLPKSSIAYRIQQKVQQSAADNKSINLGGKSVAPNNQVHQQQQQNYQQQHHHHQQQTPRRDERYEENKTTGGKHPGIHPLFQIPQGQPSQRGRGRGRMTGGSRTTGSSGRNFGHQDHHHSHQGRNSHVNNHSYTNSKTNSPLPSSHQPFANTRSTADEDIAMLAQHYSEAVINIDNKNIIRTTNNNNNGSQQSSSPLTLTQAVQQHQQQQQLHQSTTTAGVGNQHGGGDRFKMDEPTTVADKSGEHQRSKRYSSQRHRALPPIQHGQVSGSLTSASNQPQPTPPSQQQQQQQQQSVVPPPGMPPPPPPSHVPPPPAYMHPQPPPPPTAYYHAGCVDSDVVTPGQVQPVEVVTFLQPPPHALHYVQPQFIQTPTGPIPMQTPPPPAGPEMFQGGGITYYNTLSQMTQNRPNCGASRRLKVAIPIVAPPQQQEQQMQQLQQQQQQQPPAQILQHQHQQAILQPPPPPLTVLLTFSC